MTMAPLIVFGICSILYVLAAAEACKPFAVTCRRCRGSGWSGYGSGYDAICDDCAGYGLELIYPRGWSRRSR